MIFVTVGSQLFPFDRLLREVDDLIESGVIAEEVFAQTGKSVYVPKHYKYQPFLGANEFDDCLKRCSMLITHGGAGNIVRALQLGKKVLAVPRLAKYGEHVDDHQLQILAEFGATGDICTCYDGDSFAEKYLDTVKKGGTVFSSNTGQWIEELDQYIQSL